VFDAIERVEIAIRNDLILNVAVEQGAFGYLDAAILSNIEVVDDNGSMLFSHEMLLGNIRAVMRRELRAENPVVLSFRDNHPECGECLPYWLLLEVVDFGTLPMSPVAFPPKPSRGSPDGMT
jgi:abortive infection bacteriophage resistance protein